MAYSVDMGITIKRSGELEVLYDRVGSDAWRRWKRADSSHRWSPWPAEELPTADVLHQLVTQVVSHRAE
jgi:hypothetical protein